MHELFALVEDAFREEGDLEVALNSKFHIQFYLEELLACLVADQLVAVLRLEFVTSVLDKHPGHAPTEYVDVGYWTDSYAD